MLFRVPGAFGNRLRTLKGIRFSHFGDPFWRDEFKARSGRCSFVDFYDFWTLFGPPSGIVLGRECEKTVYGKTNETGCKKSQAAIFD